MASRVPALVRSPSSGAESQLWCGVSTLVTSSGVESPPWSPALVWSLRPGHQLWCGVSALVTSSGVESPLWSPALVWSVRPGHQLWSPALVWSPSSGVECPPWSPGDRGLEPRATGLQARGGQPAHKLVVCCRQSQEGQEEEGSAQEIPKCSKVRDGRVVGVGAAGPHAVDDDLAEVEQDRHLTHPGEKVEEEEERGGDPAGLQQAEDQHEEDVAGDEEEEEDPGDGGVLQVALAGAAGQAAAEGGAWEDAHSVLLTGEDSVQGVGGLVQVGGHPTRLDGHQVPAGAVHHRGEHGDGGEAVDGLVEDEAAAGADHHGEEDRGGGCILIGNIEEEGEEEDVDGEDHQGGEV